MALVNIPVTPILRSWLEGTTFASLSLLNLAGNNLKVGWVFSVPHSGSIDKVGFKTNTVTVGDTLDVRLETVDTNGFPSGTLWGTDTRNNQVVAATDDNKFFEVTLISPAVVSSGNTGDYMALVIALPAVPVGNMQIARASSGPATVPYCVGFFTAWAKVNATTCIIGSIHYSDGVGSYANMSGYAPIDGITLEDYSSSTNPNERGNKITVPFGCRVIGFWLDSQISGAGDSQLKLYDAADNQLAEQTIDGNVGLSLSGWRFIYLTQKVELKAGDVVRATRLALDANNTRMQGITCPAGMIGAVPGGAYVTWTERNGGAWTDTANKQGFIGLLIDAVDVTEAGGFVQGQWGRGGQF